MWVKVEEVKEHKHARHDREVLSVKCSGNLVTVICAGTERTGTLTEVHYIGTKILVEEICQKEKTKTVNGS